jgi:5'-deoxynucleotidase YfbR-like HD superfamily hydrolase
MSFENCQNPMETATVATLPTLTGKSIDILNPKEQDFELEDIANGLSLECRFGKQISRMYTVAQHSVLVAHLCPPGLKKIGLLHDASEAYLGDVTKPFKSLLGAAYKGIEFNFETVIFQKFGLDVALLPEIKPYDLEAYELEKKYLRLHDHLPLMRVLNEAGMIIAGTEAIWRPLVAKMEFKRVFSELFGSNMEG